MVESSTRQNRSPLIFSFFSGAGFLDLGFEAEGFELAYVNEIHQPFLNAYKHSRIKLGLPPPRYGYHHGSITELLSDTSKVLTHLVKSAKATGYPIGFIGGPPCPDFSVAGKNKGKDGENGKLSQIYIRIICEQLPDFFVFEKRLVTSELSASRECFQKFSLSLHSRDHAARKDGLWTSSIEIKIITRWQLSFA